MEKFPYLRFATKEKKKSIRHKKSIFSYKQRKVQLRPEMYLWDYSKDKTFAGFAVAIIEGNQVSVLHFNSAWKKCHKFNETNYPDIAIEMLRHGNSYFKFHCAL